MANVSLCRTDESLFLLSPYIGCHIFLSSDYPQLDSTDVLAAMWSVFFTTHTETLGLARCLPLALSFLCLFVVSASSACVLLSVWLQLSPVASSSFVLQLFIIEAFCELTLEALCGTLVPLSSHSKPDHLNVRFLVTRAGLLFGPLLNSTPCCS